MAFQVATALHAVGVTAVLTGGSAATIWSDGEYQSDDCDFIVTFGSDRLMVANKVLQALGYTVKNGTYYHERHPFCVEFPAGPLAVGEDLIITWVTLTQGDTILPILSPTDSCRDRLAHYYHWRDLSALLVAIKIAKNQPIDFEAIEQWSIREGFGDKFLEFAKRCR